MHFNAYLPICFCELSLVCLFAFRVFFTGARFAFGVDFTRFLQGNFGEQRSDEFVNQYREQGDIDDDFRNECALRAQIKNILLYKVCHTERYACLGKQGDAEILDDVIIALSELGTQKRAAVLTDRTADDVNNADENDDAARENGKL